MRPGAGYIYFLAERPYLPPGTLREVLAPTKLKHLISDAQIDVLLHELDLDQVVAQGGGLNIEQDWGRALSLAEQQRLAFAHVLLAAPRFVFIDRTGAALSPDQVQQILEMLSKNSITYINVGEINNSPNLYDEILEINERGEWTVRRISAEPAN